MNLHISSLTEYILSSGFKSLIPDPIYNTEMLVLSDGEKVAFDYVISEKSHNKWIIIIPGGVMGSSDSVYCKEIVFCFQNDYNIGIINHRGVKSSFIKPKITQHYDVDTINAVVNHIVRLNKNSEIYLIGVSMGSYMMSFYLGSEKISKPKNLKKCFSFGNYFTLENHTLSVSNCFWMNKYALNGIHKLKDKMLKDIPNYPNLIKPKCKTLEEAIMSYITPDIQSYYEKNALKMLQKSTIPIIFINASNDPLTSSSFLDFVESKLKNKKNVRFIRTENGSHIGWEVFFICNMIYNNL